MPGPKKKKKSLLLLGVGRLFFFRSMGNLYELEMSLPTRHWQLDESSRWQSALHGLNRLQKFCWSDTRAAQFLQPGGRAWPDEKVKTEMPRQPEEPWWLVARENVRPTWHPVTAVVENASIKETRLDSCQYVLDLRLAVCRASLGLTSAGGGTGGT